MWKERGGKGPRDVKGLKAGPDNRPYTTYGARLGLPALEILRLDRPRAQPTPRYASSIQYLKHARSICVQLACPFSTRPTQAYSSPLGQCGQGTHKGCTFRPWPHNQTCDNTNRANSAGAGVRVLGASSWSFFPICSLKDAHAASGMPILIATQSPRTKKVVGAHPRPLWFCAGRRPAPV